MQRRSSTLRRAELTSTLRDPDIASSHGAASTRELAIEGGPSAVPGARCRSSLPEFRLASVVHRARAMSQIALTAMTITIAESPISAHGR
jgi:hypothetical protein